jgi:toluene monooxygenase system ferredoxin subunit
MFKKVCQTDEVWEGEILEYTVDSHDVIVINVENAGFRVYDARCPHQSQSLAEASLDGNVLTCPAHLWQFDVTTGCGVNPTGCRLTRYASKVEGDELLVDLEAVEETSS